MKMTDRQAYNQNKRTIRWLNRFKIGSGAEENYDHAIEALKRANYLLDYKIRTTNASELPSKQVSDLILYLNDRIQCDYGKQSKLYVIGFGSVVDVQARDGKIYIICGDGND